MRLTLYSLRGESVETFTPGRSFGLLAVPPREGRWLNGERVAPRLTD